MLLGFTGSLRFPYYCGYTMTSSEGRFSFLLQVKMQGRDELLACVCARLLCTAAKSLACVCARLLCTVAGSKQFKPMRNTLNLRTEAHNCHLNTKGIYPASFPTGTVAVPLLSRKP